MGRNQLADLAVAATLTLLAAACTSGSPHGDAASPHAASPRTSRAAGSAKGASVLAREGLLVPSAYQAACVNEGSVCLQGAAGPIPAVLRRSLHFPVLRPGQGCPATHGRPVNTADFGGVALGSGPVRPIIAEEPARDARRGIADLIDPTSVPPWLGVKTLWFSVPAYQGPFVIRAKRLGGSGPVGLGEGPTVAPLVVPPGPTVNGEQGWREAPGGIWVRSPGCYALQVDGLTFSYVIVIRAVLP